MLTCAILFVFSVTGQNLDADPKISLPCQKPSEIKTMVLELIRSDKDECAAWGAYYAGKLGFIQFIPYIQEIVGRKNQRDSEKPPVVKKAALDALVLLNASVPAELLTARFDKECLLETMILLSKQKEENIDSLLHLMDQPPIEGQHWWATAALLTPLKPSGLIKRLIAEVRFELKIIVRENDEPILPEPRRLGGSISKSRGNPYGRSYPPLPNYDLFIGSKPIGGEVVILQNEPIYVYYRRWEGIRNYPKERKTEQMERSYKAIELLQSIRKNKEGRPILKHRIVIDWDWIDAKDYSASVISELNEIKKAYKGFVEKLLDEDLLKYETSIALDPKIVISVDDRRENKIEKLPELPTMQYQ